MTNGTALGVILVALVLALAVSASAQEGGNEGASAYPEGGEAPAPAPDYQYRDGTVIVGGDNTIDCRSFAAFFADGSYDRYGDQEQARRALEQCERAGLPAFRPPAEVRRDIRQDALSGTLPETGGVPLPLLAPAAMLLASAAGLLALRVASSTSRGERRRACRVASLTRREE